jgi:hypothetical protein
MPSYDLNTVAGASVLEVKKPQLANRYEKHFNVKAQAGLAVGDTVYADFDVPDWCRTIVVQKRTDTSNADTLTVQCQDTGLPIQPVLPIKTANAVQTGGSSSNANNGAVLMQLFPIGNKIRVALTLATSVPGACLLSICLYDY